MKKENLLRKLYELYKNSSDEELREIGDMPYDEFLEFEQDQFETDECFDDEIEYYTWAIDNFGVWG